MGDSEVTSQQMASLESADLSPSQKAVIRRAYSEAFREDMRVCTIVAGIALLWAMGTYKNNRLTRMKRREQQIMEEVERRRDASTDTTL